MMKNLMIVAFVKMPYLCNCHKKSGGDFMKSLELLVLIAMSIVLPVCAMECEADTQSDLGVDAHVGFVVYTRMKARLDAVKGKVSFNIGALRRQIEELNSNKIYISPGLYQQIQTRVKEIEADAGMKHISNDRLPIKKVKTVLYDEEFDLSCLKQKVNAHNGTSVLLHLLDRLDRIKKKSKLDVHAAERQLASLQGQVISQALYTTLLERVSEIEGSVGIKNSSDDDDTLPIKRVEDWELDDGFFDLDCFDLIVYPEV